MEYDLSVFEHLVNCFVAGLAELRVQTSSVPVTRIDWNETIFIDGVTEAILYSSNKP